MRAAFEYGEYWADMDYDVRDRYVEWIRKGAAKDLRHAGAGDGMGPRPHGSETLDKDLRVLDIGYEKTEDVFSRLYDLGFGFKDYLPSVIKKIPPSKKFAAYLIANGSEIINRKNIDRDSTTTDFFNGWDSSYHDAQWNGLSALVGYGSTIDEATERRNRLIERLVPAGDPSIKRFKMRRLVRSGD